MALQITFSIRSIMICIIYTLSFCSPSMSDSSIHKILASFSLSPVELLSAQEGVLFMQNSVDPMHNLTHIEIMLTILQKILFEKKLTLTTMEQRTVVLAIIWHDVWKSQRIRTWALPFWYDQFVEGLGSMHMFRKSLYFPQLPKEMRDEISYIIRKHANYQFFERKTQNSKLVYDLDMLERFSWIRMHKASQVLKKLKLSFILENSWVHVVFEEYYMEWLSKQPNFLYHDWAKDLMIPRKNEYFFYLEKLRRQLKKTSYFTWYLPKQFQG